MYIVVLMVKAPFVYMAYKTPSLVSFSKKKRTMIYTIDAYSQCCFTFSQVLHCINHVLSIILFVCCFTLLCMHSCSYAMFCSICCGRL